VTEPSLDPSPLAPADPTPRQELLLRIAGTAVGVWGAVLLALLGAFLTPFRIGGVLVPVSLVLAIAGTWLLISFTFDVTRHRFLALVPGLVWLMISFAGANRTTEGDLVLSQGNWVATVYLFAGAIAISVAAYRMIVPPRVPRV
jgi:hypothetical protein